MKDLCDKILRLHRHLLKCVALTLCKSPHKALNIQPEDRAVESGLVIMSSDDIRCLYALMSRAPQECLAGSGNQSYIVGGGGLNTKY